MDGSCLNSSYRNSANVLGNLCVTYLWLQDDGDVRNIYKRIYRLKSMKITSVTIRDYH